MYVRVNLILLGAVHLMPIAPGKSVLWATIGLYTNVTNAEISHTRSSPTAYKLLHCVSEKTRKLWNGV